MLIRVRFLRSVCIGEGFDAKAGQELPLPVANARLHISTGSAELAPVDLAEEAAWDVAHGLRAPTPVAPSAEGAA